MARIFDVLTENLTGNDSSEQSYGKDWCALKNRNLLGQETTHHTPIMPLLSASALSAQQKQVALTAFAPTQLAMVMANRFKSTRSTKSTAISQPFQYSYWLLMGLFLTACSGSGNVRQDSIDPEPTSIDPPIGLIEIEKTNNGLFHFSKEFNDVDKQDNTANVDDTSTQSMGNLQLPIRLLADQPIDFENLNYEVSFTNARNEDVTLTYSHADATASSSNEQDALPFYACQESDSSGYLIANYRYDFDSDRGSIYQVKVTATSERYASHYFEIEAADEADEPPVFVSALEIDVNENTANEIIHTFIAYPDIGDRTISYQFTTSDTEDGQEIENDNGLFEIDRDTGALSLAETTLLDHESGTTIYTVVVKAIDGDGKIAKETKQTFTIKVIDLNDEAPSFAPEAAITVDENSTGEIHQFMATPDIVGTAITYQLVDLTDGDGDAIDNDNDLFAVDSATGALTLKSDEVLDHEAGESRTIVVSASDGTNSATQTFTINLTDINEVPPLFADARYSFNQILDVTTIAVTTLEAVADTSDATLSYEITGGAGNDRLSGQGGNDILTGGAGNDTFVTSFAPGQVETITDFTQGEDKIVFAVSNQSSIVDLASLFEDDFVIHLSTTTDTDYTGNGENDTVMRFDIDLTVGQSDDDYLLVFEGFTDALEFADFVLVTE